jgi:hypothetical protein
MVSISKMMGEESSWIQCDLSSTLQPGGTIIAGKLLTTIDEKVDGHLTIVGKSIGEEKIH